MFELEKALASANQVLSERKSRQKSQTEYILYYSNNGKQPEGKLRGTTIKALIEEFRSTGKQYQYAFITKLNDDKVLRFYNRNESKKFFSLTRTRNVKK